MKQKRKIILYHLFFWLGYMLVSTLIEFAGNPGGYFFSIGDFFFTQFPNICTFYLCLLVFSRYLNPLKTFPLMSAVVMVYLISFLIWYVTAYHVRPLIKANGGATPEFHIWKFAVPVLWLYIKYAFFAFGYHYASENIKYQKQLRIIVEEKHQAQYAFLRAQINPHFLNNTLNFFYAKSLPLSSELSNGIMTLSEIMHYSLKQDHESQTELIEEEVDHIRNVIKINQLRFNHELQILLEVKGSTTNVRVVPLVLITIVENMLKHGDCTDPANPARITLDVVKEQNCITFKTYNIKKKGPKEQSSGIGINNIGNRLAHHYGTNFSLEITDTATDYAVELTHPILISGKN